MKYTFVPESSENFFKKVYRVDENGNRELYISNSAPILYRYGMWSDMLRIGTQNPGMQELIDKTIMYYKLLEKTTDGH